jgi:hypothetical protein
MKRWPFIVLMPVFLAGCGHSDPIDSIVKKDSADPYFPSGLTAIIKLPPTASVAEVTARALGLTGTNVTILETRQVHISYGDEDKLVPPESIRYTAVLVDTSSGRKVVLLQFERDKHDPPGGWWSRVYDIPSA